MSEHSIGSKQLLAGALLGAFIGAAGATLITCSSGKKLKSDAKAKYHEIRDTVNDLVNSCQESVSENVFCQVDEWTNKAKELFGNIRSHVDYLNIGDHKELGTGLLVGAMLGAGTALLLHKQFCIKDEGVLNKIRSQMNNWNPIISEWHRFIDEKSKSCIAKAPLDDRINDVFEFAVAGLKLWNKIKKK